MDETEPAPAFGHSDGAEDETGITEITIQPDGRIYVFGASRQILDVLAALRPDDPKLRRLLDLAKLTDPVQVTSGGSRPAS